MNSVPQLKSSLYMEQLVEFIKGEPENPEELSKDSKENKLRNWRREVWTAFTTQYKEEKAYDTLLL